MSISVVFVASASPIVGAGHVRRTAVFASYMKSIGFEVHLRGEVSQGWLLDECQGVFDSVRNLSNHEFFDVLILDSYEKLFLENAKKVIQAKFVLQIADSFTPLLPYIPLLWLEPCNPIASIVKTNEVLGSGFDYFPIHKWDRAPFVSEIAKNVLVTSGATGRNGLLERIMDASQSLEFSAMHFHLFSDEVSGNLVPKNWNVFRVGKAFESIAEKCDTVITSAGTSLWDFMANQFPIAVFALVENQKVNYEYVVKNRLALPLNSDDSANTLQTLNTLLLSPTERRNMVQNSFGLFNFGGPLKLSEIILARI